MTTVMCCEFRIRSTERPLSEAELTLAGVTRLSRYDHQETFNISPQSGLSADRALCSSQSPLNWMSKHIVTAR